MDDKIIVHRVYSIGEKDGHKLFTFRGDANPASMSGEINVTSDRIVGVFDGYQNQVLGSIVIYIQSGTGLISVFAIAIMIESILDLLKDMKPWWRKDLVIKHPFA